MHRRRGAPSREIEFFYINVARETAPNLADPLPGLDIADSSSSRAIRALPIGCACVVDQAKK